MSAYEGCTLDVGDGQNVDDRWEQNRAAAKPEKKMFPIDSTD